MTGGQVGGTVCHVRSAWVRPAGSLARRTEIVYDGPCSRPGKGAEARKTANGHISSDFREISSVR